MFTLGASGGGVGYPFAHALVMNGQFNSQNFKFPATNLKTVKFYFREIENSGGYLIDTTRELGAYGWGTAYGGLTVSFDGGAFLTSTPSIYAQNPAFVEAEVKLDSLHTSTNIVIGSRFSDSEYNAITIADVRCYDGNGNLTARYDFSNGANDSIGTNHGTIYNGGTIIEL